VLPKALSSRLSNVSLNDEQGGLYQPDFVYRGFEASPISGVAQGVAVYQDGIRLNESFGDTVNWDLIPEFAIKSFVIQSNNPLFGLNAIGGVATLEMKSGLDFQGFEAELSGGSYGNAGGNAEFGRRFGKLAVYLGVDGVHDDGFRNHSGASLRKLYSDLAYQGEALTLHLSLSGAHNEIAAVGPTPVELLALDRRATFTFPQTTQNEMEQVQFRGTWAANDLFALSFNSYYRHFVQGVVDGNTTDAEVCGNDDAQLCLEGDGLFPGDALYSKGGTTVPASALPPGATPGETDFARTRTDTYGAALQGTLAAPIGSHANHLTIGTSVDRGNTRYGAFGELGALNDNLEVIGSGLAIDQDRSPTAQPPLLAPVGIETHTTYIGVYASDIFDITPRLSWTLSGRLNIAEVEIRDQLGTELNGKHDFTRFNPGTGLTYKFAKALTVFAGYSESNRAPTAGELSCADPTSPCPLVAFLVADPPLKQVVSHNFEFGLRGDFKIEALPGSFNWSVSAYRTTVDDDILLLATDINGFGFFQNAGETRRQGVDLRLGYHDKRVRLSAGYSYLEATFQQSQLLSSSSPSANTDGEILVRPGNRIPLNPAHKLVLSADILVTPKFSLGTDLRLQSGQYLIGDESNEQPRLSGYVTVGLHASYALTKCLTLFGEVENLFDHRYNTYGAFTGLDGLPPGLTLSDQRTFSPAPGRRIFAGLRLHFD
jgi:iron complex outermembrane receptor protein